MNDVTIILLSQIPLLLYIFISHKDYRNELAQKSGFDEDRWNEAMKMKDKYGQEKYRGHLDFLEKHAAVVPDSHEAKQRRSIETTIR